MLYLVKKNKKIVRLIEFTLLQLLQHNVQLGTLMRFSLLSSYWFIFGVRQGFTVINLSQTVLQYRYFLNIVKRVVLNRRHVLFVNERRYAKVAVEDVASLVGEAYVMGRWVGGSLTNFKKLWLVYTRLLKYKQSAILSRFQLNLKNSLRGLAVLKALPAVVFFNSVKQNYWAAGESYALHIPSGGVTDSDALPDSIIYPVPGNDDALGSVLFLNKLTAKVVLVSKMETLIRVYSLFCLRLLKRAKYETNRMRHKKPFNSSNWKGQHNLKTKKSYKSQLKSF